MAGLNLRFRCPVLSLASGFLRMSSMPKQQKALANGHSCSLSAISSEQFAHGSSQDFSCGEDSALHRAGKVQALDGRLMSSCNAPNDGNSADAHVNGSRLVANTVKSFEFLGDYGQCESSYLGSFSCNGDNLKNSVNLQLSDLPRHGDGNLPFNGGESNRNVGYMSERSFHGNGDINNSNEHVHQNSCQTVTYKSDIHNRNTGPEGSTNHRRNADRDNRNADVDLTSANNYCNGDGHLICEVDERIQNGESLSSTGSDGSGDCGLMEANLICNVDSAHVKSQRKSISDFVLGTAPPKSQRPFCIKCWKAQKLCICNRFKGVVQNRTRITILQNPGEKFHAVGSARVVMLGLENVDLVDVPEIYSLGTFRIRPKIPGSKRSLTNRGGKKLHLEEWNQVMHSEIDMLKVIDSFLDVFKDTSVTEDCSNASIVNSTTSDQISHQCELLKQKLQTLKSPKPSESHTEGADSNSSVPDIILTELKSMIPPGVALLYPSDFAIELSEEVLNNSNRDRPSHLIVLDGTWSKARRVYFENPWLEAIPHYKLSHSAESIYEGVRKEPRPGCLSTVESIVFALKVLEPETKGLESLLEVFDSMVEDQRQFQQMNSNASNTKT